MTKPAPASWQRELPAGTEQVEVLPLVTNVDARWAPGWCTAASSIPDHPEIEVMCGGINSKLPSHAGVWRQGNLLHFGFEQSPDELNDNGKNLLANAVAYAARFRDDRALGRTPSIFVDQAYPKSSDALRRALELPKVTSKGLASHFAPSLQGQLGAMPVDELRSFLRERMPYVQTDAKTGALAFDEAAMALRLPLVGDAFFARAQELLADEDHAARAIEVLARHVPKGPGEGAADAWREFLEANRPYLFFSELAGHVWLLDPVAQQRRRPTHELRGPARAGAVATSASSPK